MKCRTNGCRRHLAAWLGVHPVLAIIMTPPARRWWWWWWWLQYDKYIKRMAGTLREMRRKTPKGCGGATESLCATGRIHIGQCYMIAACRCSS